MFTGLIEEIGIVSDIRNNGGGIDITVSASKTLDDLKIDDSIALDGCCQTVIRRTETDFTVTAVEETLKKTTLGRFTVGQAINLERAIRAGDRLGGHFVQGHVDCVGEVLERTDLETSRLFRIGYPEEFAHLVIPVGSIALNGTSLTAARVEGNSCTVSIIPHTLAVTTFGDLNAGDPVNVEFDMLGKYVAAIARRKEHEA